MRAKFAFIEREKAKSRRSWRSISGRAQSAGEVCVYERRQSRAERLVPQRQNAESCPEEIRRRGSSFLSLKSLNHLILKLMIRFLLALAWVLPTILGGSCEYEYRHAVRECTIEHETHRLPQWFLDTLTPSDWHQVLTFEKTLVHPNQAAFDACLDTAHDLLLFARICP